MNKNQKVLIVSVGLIALGLYYFYKQSKQKPEAVTEDQPKGGSQDIDFSAKTDWDKVLKKGDKGKEVFILQRALKQIAVDGDFGALTEARLKKVMGVTETSLNNYNKFISKK